MRAEQVTVSGHHAQSRPVPQDTQPGPQVIGDNHPGQQLSYGSGQLRRRLDQIACGAHAGQAGHIRAVAGRRRAAGSRDDQPGSARVLVTQGGQDVDSSVQAVDGDRAGRAAERRGDGLLSSVLNGQQGGQRAENARERTGLGQQHG